MNLHALIHDPTSTIGKIGAALDALSASERLEATRTLSRDDQRKLYNLAESAPATLEDFVPKAASARAPIRHYGRNTLPLPGGLRLFEKRFCRPEQGDGRLFGYNEGSTRKLIGPGYFVAHDTSANTDWQKRGAIVVDYFMVPDGAVSDGWPKVVPNTQGLQMFVFKGTRDFMRKVSKHVTIGAAYKVEKPLDHYFVLCREE
ncbi:MAG: hypothetical protein JST92_11190 [Deltaproteobacteria bacterium]|nr:hypothetical protein [Deltaproteobacteria bacterium]